MNEDNIKIFYGIILYDIEMNGCLNGVFTNMSVGGEIYNEICRKKSPENQSGEIDGNYDCQYFDKQNEAYQGELVVAKIANHIYSFEWNINGGIKFEGRGYKMNEKQISVSYWYV